MQNRYVGDIGDFGKYALLRHLSSPTDNQSNTAAALGVVWYLAPDEDDRNDGQRVEYLDCSKRHLGSYRTCAPDLYDALSEIVKGGRRHVSAIRERGVLPPDTVFYERPLSFIGLTGYPLREKRQQYRSEWFQGALDATAGCDIIFLDPDNGLEVGVKRHEMLGVKYVFLDEIAQFAARGKSMVIYHHLSRQAKALVQVQRRLEQLRSIIPNGWSVSALRYRRGTARAYFILTAPNHKELLSRKVEQFMRTPWREHFERPS